MSTIKSDSLQPTLGTNNLILKTGSADVERLRISPSGALTVSSTVSSTFSGSLTVSGAANMNGRLGIGAALSGTPNSQLEVVGSGYGTPQFNTASTTRSRAAAEFGSIVTNTRLFMGTVENEQAAWLQVQNTGNNLAYNLSLQAAGGGVAIGATTPRAPLHVFGGTRYGSYAEIRLTDEYVSNASWGILAQSGADTKIFRILDWSQNQSQYVDRFVINDGGHLACGFTGGMTPQNYTNYAGSNNYATVFSIVGKDPNGTLSGGVGDGRLELQNPVISSAVTTSTTFGRVMFVNSGQAGTNSVKAQIDCVASSAGADKGGIISFSTNPGGSSSSGLVRVVDINQIGTLIAYGSGTSPAFTVNSQVAGTAATSAVTWLRNGTACGHINFTGNTVSFTNSSDYRLKKDVLSITNGLESVCRLNPVSFKWTRGDIDDMGFIAHEVQNVVPLAAFGEKDAVNEDGSVKPQQIVMDKLVPVLVAAVKELKGIVDAQAAEIAELKAK